jgi:NADH dehydrogenase FAD-containing subunit
MLAVTVPAGYRDLDVGAAHIYLLDYGDALLKPFSDKAYAYVAKVLTDRKVQLRPGTGVKEVGPGHARLSDGAVIATRCVICGGRIKGTPVAANCGLAQGHGGRIDVQPNLTLAGSAGVYAVGDVANIAGPDGRPLPQLGSVALQSGKAAADNILAEFAGGPHVLDRGDAATIDWEDDPTVLASAPASERQPTGDGPVIDAGSVTVDPARPLFGTTSVYYVLFVPLTIGLARSVPITQPPEPNRRARL